jgi:cobalt-zinc-cadmium efflux system protein
MGGGHDHAGGGPEGHAHGVSAEADRRWIALALAFILAFMGVEVAVGLIANSLALLSDAAHMLTDAASVALALIALRLAARPPTGRYTFGLGRVEILSAQVNGASLLVLGGIIGFEAVRRLFEPPEVEGALVIMVGVAGAGVNLGSAWALSKAQRQSLNIAGARAHVLADLYSSLAAVCAGAVIVLTDFRAADGIAALLVAGLMFRSAWGLLRDSGRVLLEATPAGLDGTAVGRALVQHPGVREVHDLHVWEVTSGFPALAAHVLVDADTDCHERRRELEQMLHERFEIDHTTLQVDHVGGQPLLQIQRRPEGPELP